MALLLQEVYLMPAESVIKKSEIARELNFVVKGTLVVTDENNVLIQLVTGEGTAPSVVGEVSFLMGAPWFLLSTVISCPALQCAGTAPYILVKRAIIHL
jgi:hypothetical protein